MSGMSITMENGFLNVPNDPVVHFIEGDGIGIDITPVMISVVDESVEKAYNGEKKILKATGLLATCIQHEMDHLEGILFIDHLSKLKKSMIIKKLSKQKKSSEAVII